MSPSGGEEQVLTYLEAGDPPSQSLQEQETKGKGGVSGRLVKGNDTPTLVPRGLSVSAQPHIPTLSGALYGQVGFLKDRNPCVGLASALPVLTTCLGEKLPHMCSK